MLSVEDTVASDALLREFGIEFPPEQPTEVTRPISGDQILTRLISGKLWKHLLLIVPLIGLSLSPLWISASISAAGPAAAVATSASPDLLAHAVPPAAGWPRQSESMPRGVSGTAGTLFLLGGQLSLLIFLVRSRSTVDFRGRYRAWNWLGLLQLTAGLLLITGLSSPLIDVLAVVVQQVTGPLAAARPALLFVPLSAAAGLALSRTLPDMRGCPASLSLLSLAVVAGIVWLVAGSWLPATALSQRCSAALLLCSAAQSFAGCLLHARYVIHVNNDPPQSGLRQAAAALPTGVTTETVGVSENAVPESTVSETAASAGAATAAVTEAAADPAASELRGTASRSKAEKKSGPKSAQRKAA